MSTEFSKDGSEIKKHRKHSGEKKQKSDDSGSGSVIQPSSLEIKKHRKHHDNGDVKCDKIEKKSKPDEMQIVPKSVKNDDANGGEMKRGRRAKYATDEERIAARRQQQREYRARKKQEMEDLRSFKQSTEKKSDKKK